MKSIQKAAAAALVVGVLSTGAGAAMAQGQTPPAEQMTDAAAFALNGQCGEDLYYEFDEATGILRLKGKGQMWAFGDMLPWAHVSDRIRSVVFEEGITHISSNAFSGCTALERVELPQTLVSIEAGAFSGCESLKTVDLSATQVETIGASAFDGCAALESVALPETLSTIDTGAFSGCESLKAVDLSATKVETIGAAAFDGCAALESVALPDTVVSIEEDVFTGCDSLQNITASEEVISNVLPDVKLPDAVVVQPAVPTPEPTPEPTPVPTPTPAPVRTERPAPDPVPTETPEPEHEVGTFTVYQGKEMVIQTWASVNGHVVMTKEEIRHFGEVDSTNCTIKEYTYNGQGLPAQVVTREPETGEITTETMAYDANGNLVKQVSEGKRANGQAWSETSTWTFDDGRVVKMGYSYYVEGELQHSGEDVLTYDDAGKLLKVNVTYRNGDITKTQTVHFTYSEDGKVETQTTYQDAEPDKPSLVVITTYDDDGKLVSEDFTSDYGTQHSEYNQKGQLVLDVWQSPDDDEVRIDRYTYHANGLVANIETEYEDKYGKRYEHFEVAEDGRSGVTTLTDGDMTYKSVWAEFAGQRVVENYENGKMTDIVTIIYNEDGSVKETATEYPDGRKVTSREDENGQDITITEYPDGTKITEGKDEDGFDTITTEYPDHTKTVEILFPDNGKIVETYDAQGRQTKFEDLDADGNVIEWTEWTYDEEGEEPILMKNRFFAEDAGRWIEIHEDAEGRRLLDRHEDAEGNLIQEIRYEYHDDGGSTITTTHADGMRSVKNQYPDGTSEESFFDKDGLMTHGVRYDADGHAYERYDISEHDADGKPLVEKTYDMAGNLLWTTAYTYHEDGTCTVVVTDAQGTKVTTHPDGTKVTEGKDEDGFDVVITEYPDETRTVVTYFPENGRTVETYDAQNRLTQSENYAENGDIIEQYEWMYGETGDDPIQSKAYFYDEDEKVWIEAWRDAQNRGTKVVKKDADGNVLVTTTFEYDETGCTSTSTMANGMVIIGKPDGTTIIQNPDGTVEIKNPDGTTTVTQPDGTKITAGKDEDGNDVIITEHPDQTKTVVTYFPENGRTVETYDAQNRLTQSENYAENGDIIEQYEWMYGETGDDPIQSKAYFYDEDEKVWIEAWKDAQNRGTKVVKKDADGNVLVTTTYLYYEGTDRVQQSQDEEPDGRKHQFFYDEDGNVTFERHVETDGSRQEYTIENDVCVEGKFFDENNNLVSWYRITEQDDRGNVLKEESYDGNGSLLDTTVYTYDEETGLMSQQQTFDTEDKLLRTLIFTYYEGTGQPSQIEVIEANGRHVINYLDEQDRYIGNRYWNDDGTSHERINNGQFIVERNYDANDRPLEEKKLDQSGNTLQTTTYTYHEDGNWNKQVYDEGGNLIGVGEYVKDESGSRETNTMYTDTGKVTVTSFCDSEGNPTETCTTTWEKVGETERKVEDVIVDADGFKCVNQYGDNGKVNKRLLYDNDEPVGYMDFTYDEQGRPTEQVMYDQDDNPTDFVEWTYDENGAATQTIRRADGTVTVKHPDGTIEEYTVEPLTPENEEPADEEPADEEPADEEPADEEPTDEEPADEEPTDEEPSDEEPTDEEPADEEPTDEEPADEEPTDEEPADEEPADEEPADEEPTDEEPSDEEPTDEEPADEEPTDEEPSDEEPADEEPTDEEPSDEEPTDEEPADEEPTDEEPADEEPADEEPADEEPADEEPADEEPTDEEPADEEPADEEPADEEPTDEEPADEEPADEEPADEEPADEEPTDEEPADEEPADEEPADEEPADEEPADEEPTDEEPADEEPADEEPADEEPADEEPTDEEPADEEPAEGGSED